MEDKYNNLLIERVLNLDIVDVIGRYITLTRQGNGYSALCPFHDEKTPSFKISPGRNIFKCFGCNKGGNLIQFVKLYKNISYFSAAIEIAKEFNIPIPEENLTDNEKQNFLRRESLISCNEYASKYFQENLFKSENLKVLNYILSRWDLETIKVFNIGYASSSRTAFYDFARNLNLDPDHLKRSGLIKESKTDVFRDVFINRIIFPIQDKYGRVLAFTGRHLPGDEIDVYGNKNPKYINTRETEIYKKGDILYGLNFATRSINETKSIYLVEGVPDVIKLHQINIFNVVALSGTSLTSNQIHIIKQIANTVYIIGDSDNPGQNSVKRSADLLIDEGITVRLISLPQGENKNDPDSFFLTNEQFISYCANDENNQDYILFNAKNKNKNLNNDPRKTSTLVSEISKMICKYSDYTLREFYIDSLSKIVGNKKLWQDEIKNIITNGTTSDKKEIIPNHVDLNEFERYGFYENNDGYYFRGKNGIFRGSNFVMKPLFHIQSVLNAKRLYEIKNEFGKTEVIELLQKDLISLSAFKLRVESLGNFLWEANETELNKLKRYLYEKTESCIEINQLGWQKGGFFAWANGIYNGDFKEIDEYGIVSHLDINYYLPALSRIYSNEDSLFLTERQHIHTSENSISLNDYSKMLYSVYGDNALISLCYYFASLFRDIIIRYNNGFPILNLFGPKGTGKTELAVSILCFFGKGIKGPNINNTTKAALADHIAQISNACVHIDEYKNSIDFEKIEFLKGLWDGTGRTRMNMDKDKKKETTAVDSGIILTGQEMPTADIALFSRLIFLSFYKNEYSDAEKKCFDKLKLIEKKGLTHITNEILSHRKHFSQHFTKHYDNVVSKLNEALNDEIIEDRIFRNWAIILAAFSTLEEKINLPFKIDNLLKISVKLLLSQQRETRTSNEISTFWKLVEYMYSEGLILDGVDFRIEVCKTDIQTNLGEFIFQNPTDIIYIQYSRIIPLYRKIGNTNNEKILPSETIEYYLKHDKRYLGKKYWRFKAVDLRTGLVKVNEVGTKQEKVIMSHVFKYSELGIVLSTENVDPNTSQAQEKKSTENLIDFQTKNDPIPWE